MTRSMVLFVIVVAFMPSISLGQEDGNISEASLPYIGWQLEAPCADPAKGKWQSIATDARMGRQIAASADFYSRQYCARWYSNLNRVGRAYIDKARASNPKEFKFFRGAIAKAVKRLAVERSEDACILLTSPYQAGGDAANLMPWGHEGFYPEHDE